MWTLTKSLSTLLVLSLLCWCWPSVGFCSESRMYEISETELQTLSDHLTMLEENNKLLQTLLSESNEESATALNALMKSREELEKLKAQLVQMQKDAESARESLRTANLELQKASESFKASEREHDRIESRLRNQRNIWEILCAIAVGVAVAR